MENGTLQTHSGSEIGSPMQSHWLIVGAIALLTAGSVIAIWRYQSVAMAPPTDIAVTETAITTVTALGRLEPQGEVIDLSAPTSAQGSRVDRLLVAEGDRVEAGQVLAIMDSYDSLKAALDEATAQVALAQSQLAVVQAGAKQGELDAQRAEIARLEADYQGEIETQMATVARLEAERANAAIEFQRYESLYHEGAISASQRDSTQLTLDTSQKRLNEAQATLNRIQTTSPAALTRARSTLNQIAEIRPVDIQVAQAEINRAIATQQQAQVNFDQTQVRSPIAGEVLAIHTRAGETISSEGIVAIGQNSQMVAIAEVYQSDVAKVRVSQSVRVTSPALPEVLTGTVNRIGSQVLRQSVVNTDPSANIDARVVEIEVILDPDSSLKAAKFTNLQVQVVIEQ